MTQGEKAKRYDDALERAKNIHGASECKDILCTLETIFPELKESEDDRIKKTLIYYFNDYKKQEEIGVKTTFFFGIPTDDILAWLENRAEQKSVAKIEPKFKVGDTVIVKPMSCHGKVFKGEPFKIVDIIEDNYVSDDGQTYNISLQDGWELVEQKPTDKVEPKFHVGDWVVENTPNNYARFIQILEVVNVYGKERYRISRDIHNDEDVVECRFIENNYHFFTIQDAKPGDVLVHNNCTFIFMRIKDGIVQAIEENMLKPVPFGEPDKDNDYHPATKEQRDTLFKMMHEQGYNWDDKNKELFKVEQKQVIDYLDSLPKDNWELIHEFVNEFGRIPKDEDELNVLVKYVLKKQKPTWSEEDEEHIKSIISTIERCKTDLHSPVVIAAYNEDLNWLKSLRPQND